MDQKDIHHDNEKQGRRNVIKINQIIMSDDNQDKQQEMARKALIDELGMGELSKDKQDELLIKMTEVVLRRIFTESIERLSENDQEEYMKMIDSGTAPDELEEFLKEKIVGYDEMVKKIIEEFKSEMKAI